MVTSSTSSAASRAYAPYCFYNGSANSGELYLMDRQTWMWPWYSTRSMPSLDTIGKHAEQRLPLAATLPRVSLDSQKQSRLLRLPAEIRNFIWKLALTTYLDPERPYTPTCTWWRPNSSHAPRLDPALLRTCRGVYLETWDLPMVQTVAFIYEGSVEDKPGEWARINVGRQPPGVPQAWQALLLSRLNLSLQQFRLEHRGVEDWIASLANLKKNARVLMDSLITEAKAKGLVVDPSIISRLMNQMVEEITIKIHRCDWWSWSSNPTQQQIGDLIAAETRGQAAVLQGTPKQVAKEHIGRKVATVNKDGEVAFEPFRVGDNNARDSVTCARRFAHEDEVTRRRLKYQRLDMDPLKTEHWGAEVDAGDIEVLSPNLEVRFVLETFGPKVAQLERAVNWIKTWKLTMPPGLEDDPDDAGVDGESYQGTGHEDGTGTGTSTSTIPGPQPDNGVTQSKGAHKSLLRHQTVLAWDGEAEYTWHWERPPNLEKNPEPWLMWEDAHERNEVVVVKELRLVPRRLDS